MAYWDSLQYDYEKLINIAPNEAPFSEDTLAFLNWGVDNTALFVTLIILVILIFLALNLFLTAFCTTALIKGTLLADAGQKS